MIRRLLLTSVATALLSGVASAADLPRQAPPPPPPPPPLFTWTGFYAGINLGYGFDATSDNGRATVLGIGPRTGLVVVPTVIAFRSESNLDGFVGGGQIGYNYQFTPGSGFVIGFEADAQYVDFGRNRNSFIATGPIAARTVFNPAGISGLDWFGTVRGRIGYAWNRVLFYGTGGFAYGSGGGLNANLPNVNVDDWQTGWTAGGGFEYALPTDSFLNFFRSSTVSLKVEGLYVNMSRENRLNGAFAVNNAGTIITRFSPDVVVVNGANLRRNTEFAVVRAGLNYKFGTW